MDAAGTLKRAAMIGLTVASLTIGSTLIQPAVTASASVLPDSHVGTPDVGYPSSCQPGCVIWTVPASPPPSGDVGYPCPGTNTGCDFQARPTAFGDVGYPNCPGCYVGGRPAPSTDVEVCPNGCDFQTVPPPSSDIGYPTCGSGCGVETAPPASGDVAYPGCPSCNVQDQPGTLPAPTDHTIALSPSEYGARQAQNPSGWGDGTKAN